MNDETSLSAKIGTEPTRAAVVSDCESLVDAEVRAKSGMSGVAIKLGYKTVKAIKPTFVRDAIDGLLDDWLDRLEPFHQQWRTTDVAFSDFVGQRSDEVAEAMLSVTDERAEVSEHKTAKKMYKKLRPSAKENVVTALPKLSKIIEGHLAASNA